jgi:cysteine desulfurase/selenocysteine lyase
MAMTTSKAEQPNTVDFSVEQVRKDFPILQQSIHGHPLAFLDNAASSQRPRVVIDAISNYYERDHANVHRGVHTLSHRATEAYEGAREKIRSFINAASTHEIIFTRGTTDAINLVATSFGERLGDGDEIIISHLEHHSNIVPWQMLCDRTGAVLKVIPINDRGEIIFDEFTALLGPRTRLLALSHVSNALGTVTPVEKFIAAAKERDIPVLLDGAQAVPHQSVDMRALGCDFYAFSGHKMIGPTGIGVLYGREEWLEKLPPYQGGGDMILSVSFSGTTFNELPYKFEAGTPNIAGAIGLGVAVDYLLEIGMDEISRYEAKLLDYATNLIRAVDGIRLFGTAEKKASVISFNLGDIHPHDLGTILDHQGVAIRTGHHCAMPVMEYFGIAGTARASMAFYNNEQDIDQLVNGLALAIKMFR